MSLLLIIIILLLVFGGGGFSIGGSVGAGSALGTFLIIILVLWLLGIV